MNINEARLISYEELISLGCNKSSESCSVAPEWIYSTSFWSGSVRNDGDIWVVISMDGFFGFEICLETRELGVRPVIVVPKSEFN